MTTRSCEVDLMAESAYSITAHNRRQEARIEDAHCCAFEMCESDQDGAMVICEGQLVTVNRSAHGILLMMREAPRVNQLIEVHNAKLGWLRSMMVYQVQWTRPVHVESHGDMFLVGCRLTVGLPATRQIHRAPYTIGSV